MITASRRSDFIQFYRGAYRDEHGHPMNIALHVFGTLAGVGLIIAGLTIISPWWMLLFPIIHAAPGLIGHRLIERSDTHGDTRLLRTDFPLYWFIIANHLLTVKLLFTGRR
jgi:hypothetical protein